MSAVLTPPEAPTATFVPTPPEIPLAPVIATEQRLVLYDVSWTTYKQLLLNYQDKSSPRFTYDKGTLEILMPSRTHEATSRFFEVFVSAIVEERELEIHSIGSTTNKREDLQRGAEPDTGFYLQNAALVPSVGDIDLSIYPPPDLVVEIDVTSPSLDKFPIYAEMGVPEIWRYVVKNDAVTIFLLQAGKYVPATESLALPPVTAEILTRFLQASRRTKRRSEWLRELRSWARKIA